MKKVARPEVAIVGSGIAGTTIAHLLTQWGHDVAMLEIGPDYPYPHMPQYVDEIRQMYRDPAYTVPEDLRALEVAGDYKDSRTLPFDA